MENLRICFLGGDRRMVEAAKIIRQKFNRVKVWGIDPSFITEDIYTENFNEAIDKADIVILPTPPSEDEVRVNCPLYSKESGIKLNKVFDSINENTLLLGGRMSPRLRDIAQKKGITAIDYFNREELLMKNAIPTAEGAIGIAVEKSPKTIFNSKIAVIGFGRIGEALAVKLGLLGGRVTVFARSNISIAKAQSEGLENQKISFEDKVSTIAHIADGYDMIFNTVPYWLITEDIVEKIPKTSLYVELASAPGGIDMVAAKKYNFDVIRAPSLPARTAPITAGEIVAESILNIIKEEKGV